MENESVKRSKEQIKKKRKTKPVEEKELKIKMAADATSERKQP